MENTPPISFISLEVRSTLEDHQRIKDDCRLHSWTGQWQNSRDQFPATPLGQGPAAPGCAEMRSWGDEDGIRDTHPSQLSAQCMGREGCIPSAGSIFQKSVQQHSSAVLQTSWWIDSSWDIFLVVEGGCAFM